MKCNPLRWLWALPVVALIWWLAQQGERARIEADLKSRATVALAAAGQQWATAGFNGRDAWVRGKAFNDTDQSRAIDAARKTWGVRIVEDRTALADIEKNFNWTAALGVRRVQLTGFVPSEQARPGILAAVKAALPDREIVDEMKPARGAPKAEIWLAGVTFAARQLARLKPGSRASLSATRLSVEGEALDFAGYRTVKSALANSLPAGLTLASERVQPPIVSPFTWSAKYSGSQIDLAGHVPSDAARDSLLARIKGAMPSAAIVDRMANAGGAPANWTDAATVLLVELARLEKGEAKLSATAASFDGETAKEEVARQIETAVQQRLPKAFRVQPAVRFRDPDVPLINPYVLSFLSVPDSVTISGYVADENQRKSLIERVSAKMPNRRIVDATKIGRGQPEGWRACVQAGIDGVSALVTGSAELSGRNLRISGVTDDEETAEKLPGVVRAAANRACQDEVSVTLNAPPEPNFEWRASRSDSEIILDGGVTDSATKALLVEAARKLFGGMTITDRTRIIPAKSSKWPRVAQSALAMLAQLRTGEVVVTRQTLSVSGMAPDTAVVAAIRTQLRNGLAKGYRGEDAITVRSDAMLWAEQEARRKAEADARQRSEQEARREAEAIERARLDAEARTKEQAEQRRRQQEAEQARRQADAASAQQRRQQEEAEQARRRADAVAAEERRRRDEAAARAVRQQTANRCQDEMNRAATEGVIRFARASATIERASSSTLDALARVAKGCPGFNIVVGGHTDAEGTDERNQRLSDRRANAVVDHLVDAGIERDRIKAIGFGSSKPIADNETNEGRARNRRIEFTVTPD